MFYIVTCEFILNRHIVKIPDFLDLSEIFTKLKSLSKLILRIIPLNPGIGSAMNLSVEGLNATLRLRAAYSFFVVIFWFEG